MGTSEPATYTFLSLAHGYPYAMPSLLLSLSRLFEARLGFLSTLSAVSVEEFLYLHFRGVAK